MQKNAVGRLVPSVVNGAPQVAFQGVNAHRPQGRRRGPLIPSVADFPPDGDKRVPTIREALERCGLRQCAATTRGGQPFDRFDWSGPVALWVGSETGDAPAVCASMESMA